MTEQNIYIAVGFLLIFIIYLFSITLYNVLRYSWKDLGNGEYLAIDRLCPKGERCEMYCFSQIRSDIWKYCKEYGFIIKNHKKESVLCFPKGCYPKIRNSKCELICE